MPEYIVLRSSGKQATEDAPRREKISRRIWNSDDHFGRRNPAALSAPFSPYGPAVSQAHRGRISSRAYAPTSIQQSEQIALAISALGELHSFEATQLASELG